MLLELTCRNGQDARREDHSLVRQPARAGVPGRGRHRDGVGLDALLTSDGQIPNYADVGPTALTLPGSMIGTLFAFLPISHDGGAFWWMWLSGVTVGR